MKTRYSWELIFIGLIITGVGFYLFTSSNEEYNNSDEYSGEEFTRGDSIENILTDEPEEPVTPTATAVDSPDFATEYESISSILDENTPAPADVIEQEPRETGAIAEPLTVTTSTEDKASKENEISNERMLALGAVLNQVGSAVDEMTRSGDFNNRFNEDKARLIKEETFPAFALAEVRSALDAGNIQLLTHSGSDVIVQIWASERNSSSEFDQFYRTTISKTPEAISVEVRRREQNESWISRLQRLWSTDVGNSITAGVRIIVPEGGLTYHLSTQAGNIEAYNAGGDITIDSRAGNIVAEGLYGRILAETRAGNIRADKLSGTVALRTRAGNITADNLRANTELRSRAGNITATAITANHRIDAESRVGNVDIRIPSDTRADLSIDGSNVTLHEAFALDGDKDARFIRGTLNGGGPLIRAHARVGNCRILPLE